ncbi:unnamed protein product [Dicrocoelium dendriticum]|nr:unnamed protein product [Dicrocoelium dendriticum]
MGIFGEKKDPREKLREMVSVVRKQKFKIQRDVNALQVQNKKVALDIKKRAKDGKLDEAKILAKELVNSRKAVSRLLQASAHMDCVISELNSQASTLRLAGCLKSSTGVMKSMSALIKLPDLQKTMQDLGKEMMKMGLIDEMVQDTMESAMGDPDDMEDAISAEVDKVLSEITAGEISKAPDAIMDSIPAGTPIAGGSRNPAALQNSVEEDDREDLAEMQARLAALRS